MPYPAHLPVSLIFALMKTQTEILAAFLALNSYIITLQSPIAPSSRLVSTRAKRCNMLFLKKPSSIHPSSTKYWHFPPFIWHTCNPIHVDILFKRHNTKAQPFPAQGNSSKTHWRRIAAMLCMRAQYLLLLAPLGFFQAARKTMSCLSQLAASWISLCWLAG